MSSVVHDAVPAFLSIDVEPDAFQIERGGRDHWPGYAAMTDFAGSLRESLARASRQAPVFGWYFRMDPQIAAVCGRADVAVTGFRERVAALERAGDYFGVHMHPLRWSEARAQWVHDFADAQWLRESTQFTLDAFRACFGRPCPLFRAGAGFMSNDIVDVLDRNGVVMEMSLEPVASWGLSADVVPTAVDASPIVGAFIDCARAPRTAYHPSRADFRRRGEGDARDLLMVPMTSASPPTPRGVRSHVARWWRGSGGASAQMLYPSLSWRSERHFWDLVAREVDLMDRPYVSLGVRTDRHDAALTGRVYRLFAALADHPLVERLRFVNPLDCAARFAHDAAIARRAHESHAPRASAGEAASRVM
jgi:hypothetical protein